MSTRGRPNATTLRLIQTFRDSGTLTPETLAREIAGKGLRQVQLASETQDPELSRMVSEALKLQAGAALEPTTGVHLGSQDALVLKLDDDHMVVFGHQAAVARLVGRPVSALPESVGRGLLRALPAGSVLTSGLAVSELARGGQLYRQTAESLAKLGKLTQTSRGGDLIGVARGSSGKFTGVHGFEKAGSAMRTAGAATSLITLCMTVAGVAHVNRRLESVHHLVREHLLRDRDQRIAEITNSSGEIEDVVESLVANGEWTTAIWSRCPDLRRQRETVLRSEIEIARHVEELRVLPSKARAKAAQLVELIPDMLESIAIYQQAEQNLYAAEVLSHAGASTLKSDAGIAHLAAIDERKRQARIDAASGLAEELDGVVEGIEEQPGDGWFSGAQRAKVRSLLKQFREELDGLGIGVGVSPPRRSSDGADRPQIAAPAD